MIELLKYLIHLKINSLIEFLKKFFYQMILQIFLGKVKKIAEESVCFPRMLGSVAEAPTRLPAPTPPFPGQAGHQVRPAQGQMRGLLWTRILIQPGARALCPLLGALCLKTGLHPKGPGQTALRPAP